MGSEGKPHDLKIPVIDFSVESLKPESPEWESVRGQVRRAVEEFGCFEAVSDRIPLEFRREFFRALEQIFELPLETKQQNVSDKPYRGYIGQIPTLPLYESLGIENVNFQNQVESFANMLWPQGNPAFCETIEFYKQQLSELDQIIRRMILESLGVEKYLDDHLESTNSLLRFMKYKGPQTTETKTGLSPHTDKNIVTILVQNQVDGLEVQTKDGQWISVQPSPGSFVVMTGDSFHAWTNGRVHSVCHRVIMGGNETRYSAGFFSGPKAGYLVKAPQELVDQKHPLLFKPFDCQEFVKFFSSEAGRKAGNDALKVYCGVTQ